MIRPQKRLDNGSVANRSRIDMSSVSVVFENGLIIIVSMGHEVASASHALYLSCPKRPTERVRIRI